MFRLPISRVRAVSVVSLGRSPLRCGAITNYLGLARRPPALASGAAGGAAAETAAPTPHPAATPHHESNPAIVAEPVLHVLFFNRSVPKSAGLMVSVATRAPDRALGTAY